MYRCALGHAADTKGDTGGTASWPAGSSVPAAYALRWSDHTPVRVESG
jgi:hypothetical protein